MDELRFLGTIFLIAIQMVSWYIFFEMLIKEDFNRKLDFICLLLPFCWIILLIIYPLKSINNKQKQARFTDDT